MNLSLRSFCFLTLILLNAAEANAQGTESRDSTLAATSHVRIEHLKTWYGKPPLKYELMRLTLTNPHDKPIWFAFPNNAYNSLPADGIFRSTYNSQTGKREVSNKNFVEFSGKKYEGGGGSVVEVTLASEKGFRAFHLPAKGCVELEGYKIEATRGEISKIEVMEAKELVVNGKTPLEKWLPYSTTSSAKVKIDEQTLWRGWQNLYWGRKKLADRDDFPKERVLEVKAEEVRRWILEFELKRDKVYGPGR